MEGGSVDHALVLLTGGRPDIADFHEHRLLTDDRGMWARLAKVDAPPQTSDANVWRFPPRALPTETKVESGTSQSKSGIFVNLSNSGEHAERCICAVSERTWHMEGSQGQSMALVGA